MNNEVDSVVFNSLINSKVVLPRQIQKLTIQHSTFDMFSACDHVISNVEVLVEIEDKDLKTYCVSKPFISVLQFLTYATILHEKNIDCLTY